jgi:acyl dehydratase
MSDPLLARVGETLRRFKFPIEGGKVSEFTSAISGSIARPAAVAEGAATFAPPTYTAAASFFFEGGVAQLAVEMGLDMTRLLHGGHSWTYHKPIVVGDVLDGSVRLKSVGERRTKAGSSMRVVEIETIYMSPVGDNVVAEVMTMIELPPKD